MSGEGASCREIRVQALAKPKLSETSAKRDEARDTGSYVI